MVRILLRRLDDTVPVPTYARDGDAGADLCTTEDLTLAPGERALVGTGIALALPEGYVGLVHPRSGLALRHGLSIVNTPGTVDAGYRGEVKVLLVNLDATSPVSISRGDRIAQLVVQRVERADFAVVDDLPPSERGAGGYGSTGGAGVLGPGTGPRSPDQPPTSEQPEEGHRVRFRKKSTEGADVSQETDDEAPVAEEPDGPDGPFDEDDVDLEEDPAFAEHVDLGGLVVAPPFEGADLRLQIDEETGAVLAVLIAGEDGALELRAFSASRSDRLWPEVREAMQAEAESHGGQTSERTGTWGTELVCQIPVELPDGQSGVQPSRVIGVEKGRWLLRATLLGRPALEPEDAQVWEQAISGTVVRRGTEAMPPGEPIGLRLPPDLEAQLQQQEA